MTTPRLALLLSSLSVALLLAACGPTTPPASPAFTVHYHRAASDYAGWTVTASAGAVETAAVAASGTDGWGATFPLTVASGAQTLTFTVKGGGGASEGQPFTVDVSGAVREAWLVSGFATAITEKPPAIPDAGSVALYYKRADTDYAGWGLHLWGDQVVGTSWGAPLAKAGISAVLGEGFVIPTPGGQPLGNCSPGKVCFIIHKGDSKDPGPDMSFDPVALGNIVFVTSGSVDVTSTPAVAGAVSIKDASAHLLRRGVVAWKADPAGGSAFELRWSPTADIKVQGADVVGGSAIPLNPSGTTVGHAVVDPLQAGNLADFQQYTLDAGDLSTLKQALKGQLVAVKRGPDGGVVEATQVQTGFGLDDLFAHEGPLGPSFDAGVPTLALWAPTAQAVTLKVYDDAKALVEARTLTEGDHGVWATTGPTSWKNRYYQYEVTVFHPSTSRVQTFAVTDPYSVNLSTNGTYSQLVDLSDPALMPDGWTTFTKPPLAAPEDIVVYEGHVRDFSVFDPTVAPERAGKYLAFSPDGGLTAGQAHLKALAQAGLTHLHLLPAFDIATVNEDPTQRVELGSQFSALCAANASVPAATCTQFAGKTVLQALQSYDGGSDQQQQIATWMANLDGFNWGYDPFHYGAPEGSYASTAEGTAKVVEFRQMVMGLASLGLRTVMDVVYNHTNAAGAASQYSVLDKVVPGYYHRRDPVSGSVQTSSCCQNTASERRMMEKLMVDTLVRWARDFKVDGFRFDLMGLHFRSNILKAQAALQALTPGADGVDGSRIYLYGEGWTMGEMAPLGTAATQDGMFDAGVGTFNDRLRDAVRGGGPFDNGLQYRQNQGFSNGLFYDPNETSDAGTTARQKLLDTTLWIKVAMAGNLTSFRLVGNSGNVIDGTSIGYGSASAGYAADPQEAINYVSAHDNQTLWDVLAYKFPTGTPPATRVRAYDVALDTVLLGQGVPFFHLGDDLLRSKSLDKNSYDSGDWFNQVDWSGQRNGWRIGLPRAGDNSADWPYIAARFAEPEAAVGPGDIAAASAHFQEMLKVRKSSVLFRLRTREDVQKRVDFLNAGPTQIPGLIAMTITDGTCAGADLDPARDALVVIINADKVSHQVTVPGASGFTLHALLQASADATVRTATASGTTFTVPARTSAVFEALQSGSQGAGLPCNTR